MLDRAAWSSPVRCRQASELQWSLKVRGAPFRPALGTLQAINPAVTLHIPQHDADISKVPVCQLCAQNPQVITTLLLTDVTMVQTKACPDTSVKRPY